jgi:hypothetical protein
MAYHDKRIRSMKAKRVQVDEIWTFFYAKQKNVADAKAAPEGAGDTWTWVALDADSKLVVSYFLGGRDGECAKWFMETSPLASPTGCISPVTAIRPISTP